MTTPEQLPSLSLRRALDALLSPKERRQPYRIFMIPGLLAACTLWILYILGTIAARHFFIIKQLPQTAENWEDFKPFIVFVVGAIVFSLVLNVLVLTPLEVMIVRLSIQTKANEYGSQAPLLLDTTPNEDAQTNMVIGPVR